MPDQPMQVCGHRTRHTARIGCCAGCKRLFSSDTAFEKHRRSGACVAPESIGMVQRESRTAPGEFMWALPGGSHSWGDDE